jgi:2-polyprenyl-6-methoxyphenol hydroxylase-like FAD-dependent oxidoreductase
LPSPDIYEVIRNAEPLGEATTARFPASVWRRFDKLGHFPEGYLVFGDAISSFNPRYGQGMSVAALQALELQRTLMERPDHLAPRFFARAAKVIEIPWTISATNDLLIPEAQGPRTVRTRVMNWYMARLLRTAHHDARVALTFHQVANLLAAPTSILAPGIALRVLRSNLPGAGWMTGWNLQTRDAR